MLPVKKTQSLIKKLLLIISFTFVSNHGAIGQILNYEMQCFMQSFYWKSYMNAEFCINHLDML